jgi:hypothetical protein
VLHVIKSVAWVASIAALIFAFVVARDEFFRRQNFVSRAVGGNRETIRKRLRCGKRPAGTTLTLITDGVNKTRPLGAAVKRRGEIGYIKNRGVGAVDFGVSVELDTEKSLGLPDGQACKAWVDTSASFISLTCCKIIEKANKIWFFVPLCMGRRVDSQWQGR